MTHYMLDRAAERTVLDRFFHDYVDVSALSIKKLNGEKDYVFTHTNLKTHCQNLDLESEALFTLYQANVIPNSSDVLWPWVNNIKKYLTPLLKIGIFPRCGLRSKAGESFLSDSASCMKTRSGKELSYIEQSQWFQRLLVSLIKLWSVYVLCSFHQDPPSNLVPVLINRTHELSDSILLYKDKLVKHELLKCIHRLLDSTRFKAHLVTLSADQADEAINKINTCLPILSRIYHSHILNNIGLLEQNQVGLHSDVVSHIVNKIDWKI